MLRKKDICSFLRGMLYFYIGWNSCKFSNKNNAPDVSFSPYVIE